jgi:hypothetical protein
MTNTQDKGFRQIALPGPNAQTQMADTMAQSLTAVLEREEHDTDTIGRTISPDTLLDLLGRNGFALVSVPDTIGENPAMLAGQGIHEPQGTGSTCDLCGMPKSTTKKHRTWSAASK